MDRSGKGRDFTRAWRRLARKTRASPEQYLKNPGKGHCRALGSKKPRHAIRKHPCNCAAEQSLSLARRLIRIRSDAHHDVVVISHKDKPRKEPDSSRGLRNALSRSQCNG